MAKYGVIYTATTEMVNHLEGYSLDNLLVNSDALAIRVKMVSQLRKWLKIPYKHNFGVYIWIDHKIDMLYVKVWAHTSCGGIFPKVEEGSEYKQIAYPPVKV